MAKNKDNQSNGNGKRWVTFIAILVLIAIIVVLIVIFIPANTSDAKRILNDVSSSSYLDDEDEKSAYQAVGEKLSSSTKSYYMTEYNDILLLSEGISDVLQFYDDYLVFAKDNKVLSSNYKTIRNNLNRVKSSKEDLNELVATVNSLEEDSDSYIKNLWIDFRGEYVNWLESNAKAISALNNCYQGCFDNTLSNNLASSTILTTVDNYLTSIINKFNAIIDVDKKNTLDDVYSYSISGQIRGFSRFVNSYIVDTTDIVCYNFETTYQGKYNLINQFCETFAESDLIVLIDSMDAEGNITKTYETTDMQTTIFEITKSFIEAKEG